MQSFTTTLAALALFAIGSASPIARRDTCGSAPSGSTSQTPLSQPTGITTAALCLARCEANTSCQSFLFGMVDNVVECELFSVPASSLPTQSSTNLVAYDKACTSVPTVVPTAANPTGVNVSSGAKSPATTKGGAHKRQNAQVGTHAAPIQGMPAGNPTSISAPSVSSLDACLAACKANPSCVNYVFTSNTCKLFGSTNKKRQNAQVGTHNAPIQGMPAGNPRPIATPSGVTSVAGCLSDCQSNPSCVNYLFSNNACKLYGPISKRQNQTPTHAAPMNSAPAGNPTPIATPAVTSLNACLTSCKGKPSCIQYTFVNNVCKLFA